MLLRGKVLRDYIVIDEKNTYIDDKSVIKKGAIIYPFSVIINSIIEENVKIMSNCHVEGSHIMEGAQVFYSVVEESIVGKDCVVGPFAHLRPNSKICDGAKIGNFVEIKNSEIGSGTKVSHLSYVGDASVGEKVNIGCGVVFVNYNGRVKNRTRVGNNAFIGSSVNLIAPVSVGDGAFVCAGTTVDSDVEAQDFVIGRSKMTIKPGRANKYLKGE